jgi:outer membrane protein TolC
MTILRRVVFAVLVSLPPSPLWAAGGEAVPSPEPQNEPLAALVGEALANNPDLLAVQEALGAARERPAQARSLADPMLSVAYTNDGWSPSLGTRDMTTLSIMGSQVLPWPGKRRLRGEIAGLEADGIAPQVDRVKLGLTAAVKRAYWSLVLVQELRRLIDEQEETWKEIEGVARARYAVGQGAQQDVLRVQVEQTRIAQLQAEQQAETEVRRAELNRLLARSADSPLEVTGHLVLLPDARSAEERLRAAEAASPELRAGALAIERDRLAVSLARKDFRPDFTVQAGYMNRGGLDPMWQAGLGITLPIYRKRLASGLAEADARARESQHRLESIRLQLRYRTQERLAQLRTADTVARLYGDGIIPQGQMSVEAAIANYQAGKVPFISVLEALSTLYGDRSTLLRVLAGRERIQASLEEASLESTSEMPAGGAAPAMSLGTGSAGATASSSGGAMASGGMGK